MIDLKIPTRRRATRNVNGTICGILSAACIICPFSRDVNAAPADRAPAGCEAGERPDSARCSVLHLGVGGQVEQIRDDKLRPLTYAGGGPALMMGWAYARGPNRATFDLDAGLALISNRYGHDGAVINARVGGGYLRLIWKGKGAALFGGAAYRCRWLLNYSYDWDDSFMYWLTAHTLDGSLRLEWLRVLGGVLGVTLDMPLIGGVSRPPEHRANKVDPLPYPGKWLAYTHADMAWAHLGNFWAPQLGIYFQRFWTERWGFRAGIETWLVHTQAPGALSDLQQRVTVELSHGF